MRGHGRMTESPELRAEPVDLRVLPASCNAGDTKRGAPLQTAREHVLTCIVASRQPSFGTHSAQRHTQCPRFRLVDCFTPRKALLADLGAAAMATTE